METAKNNRYALITGASKGIGKAIAAELARRGHHLLLVARSEDLLAQLSEELQAAHGVRVRYRASDLSQPNAASDLLAWCTAEGLVIDMLINNAGFGVWDPFAEANLDSLINMNALNVDAVVRLSHTFLPMLRAQPKAWLLNVSSMGAFQPIPNMALYGAGKAYVRSFTRALRDELRGTSVRVTCLCPGGVWTEFPKRAGNEVVSERAKNFMMAADKCARITVRAMLRGKAEVVPGWYNVVGVWMAKHLPTSWSIASARRIFRKD